MKKKIEMRESIINYKCQIMIDSLFFSLSQNEPYMPSFRSVLGSGNVAFKLQP